MTSGETRPAIRAERSRRAVAAAVELAGEHGLPVGEPRVLADMFSVMVHLFPAPVVARVSTWTATVRTPIEDWLAREVAVTGFLAGQGAPVVAPSAELPPGPHTRDGFGINFWTYLDREPDRWASMADCSAMLVDLHACLRGYPGELPVLAPVANDIPLGLDLLDRAGDVLRPGEADALRAHAERLREFAAVPGAKVQPLHGDVHPGNLVATRDGKLVWIDFEDVCLGPVEWDLALLTMFDGDTISAHHRPDPDTLRLATELRALHLTLCGLLFRDDFGDRDGWDDDIRTMLAMLP